MLVVVRVIMSAAMVRRYLQGALILIDGQKRTQTVGLLTPFRCLKV
jgi:hypothetical protein